MLLTDRELDKLEFILDSTIYNLYALSYEEAIRRIEEARKTVSDHADTPTYRRVRRALDTLEEMLRRYHESISSGSGPAYELVWRYLHHIIGRDSEWHRPILESPDEVLKHFPLIATSPVGYKEISCVISPTPVELRYFLSIMSERGALEDALDDIKRYLESLLKRILTELVTVEKNRIILRPNRVIEVTPEEAARVADILGLHDSLGMVRTDWYKRMAEALSNKAGVKVSFDDVYSRAEIVIDDDVFRKAGINASCTIVANIWSDGIVPKRLQLFVDSISIEGVPVTYALTLTPSSKSATLQQFKTPEEAAEQVSGLISRAIKIVHELHSKLHPIITSFRDKGYVPKNIYASPSVDTVRITAEKTSTVFGTVEVSVEISQPNNEVKAEIAFDEKLRRKMNKRHRQLIKELSKKVAGEFKVDYYVFLGRPRVEFKSMKSVQATLVELADRLLATTEEAYIEAKTASKFKIGTREAIALFILYCVDRDVAKRLEEKTGRSMSEVFMKVGAFLFRRGLAPYKRPRDDPLPALLRILDSGAVSFDRNGHIYVRGARLTDLIPWTEEDLEKLIINFMVSKPSTATRLLKMSAVSAEDLPEDVAVHLLEDGNTILELPAETVSSLLRKISPSKRDAVLRYRLAKPSSSSVTLHLLYAAGMAGAGPELTRAVVESHPQLLGQVDTVSIGNTIFIDKGDYVVLFSGLTRPAPNALKVFEVYDRKTKRGVVVAAESVDDAVLIASAKIHEAYAEFRALVRALDVYESKYGVQIELRSRNREGFVVPEVVVKKATPGGERTLVIPLQPGLLSVLDKALRDRDSAHATSTRMLRGEG